MKIVYMGTPDFAVRPLEALINSRHEVVAVVSQPDREKDRKGNLLETPVKQTAKKHNIPVFQFEKISRNVEELKKIQADIMITCAYGQILTKEILDLKKFGIINIHASLLPKYRGAAPIQWALINGEVKTGVTIMQTVKELDAGDIIYSVETAIEKNENARQLFFRLSEIGAKAVLDALDLIESGKAINKPQDNSKATYFPMLSKADGKVDFSKSAEEINNLIRGVYIWPTAYSLIGGQLLKIFKAEVLENDSENFNFGIVTTANIKSGLIVSCKKGTLKLIEVQLAGSKRMPVSEFLKGKKIDVGTILGK